MEKQLLRSIGMTDGEINVYFALLELGSSTVGPIIDKSKISSSKVYDVLNRLIDKGLASFAVQANMNHYEAAPPNRILDYIQEKKDQLSQQEEEMKQILPELEMRQKLNELKSQAHVFKGNKGFKTAFGDIIASTKPGEKLMVMGIFAFDPEFQRMVVNFHKRRAAAGIEAEILLNEEGKVMGNNLKVIPRTKIKYMQKGIFTPTVFLIYANKVLLTLPKSRTFFRIENKEAYETFKTHFENNWKQDTFTLRGQRGIVDLCEQVLKEKEDMYLIGANAFITKIHKKYFEEWDGKRVKASIKRNHLSVERTRGSSFNKLPNTKVKYLPESFESPLVIWVFGNKVAHVLWEKEQIVFLIDNKRIADDYRKYYSLLEKIATD